MQRVKNDCKPLKVSSLANSVQIVTGIEVIIEHF